MTDSTAINGRAGAKHEHQHGQSHENELDMLFLNSGQGGEEAKQVGFHDYLL
jgi:hypothetical protein